MIDIYTCLEASWGSDANTILRKQPPRLTPRTNPCPQNNNRSSSEKKQRRTQMEWRHLKQPTNQPDKTRTSPAPPTHSNGTKIASWQLNVRLCLGMQSCFSQAKYTCSSQANKHTNNQVTHTESHASAVSLLESGEQRYIKTINKQIPLFPPSSKFSDTRRTKL